MFYPSNPSSLNLFTILHNHVFVVHMKVDLSYFCYFPSVFSKISNYHFSFEIFSQVHMPLLKDPFVVFQGMVY